MLFSSNTQLYIHNTKSNLGSGQYSFNPQLLAAVQLNWSNNRLNV